MSSLSDLDQVSSSPNGWESGLKWDGDAGVITTPAMDSPPDLQAWGHVLKKFGLDPEKYAIDGKVRHSAWEVPGHGVQHAYILLIVLS